MERLAVINDEIIVAIEVAKQELESTVMSGDLNEEDTVRYDKMISVLDDSSIKIKIRF